MINANQFQSAGEFIGKKIADNEPLLLVNKPKPEQSLFFDEYLYHYLKTLPRVALYRLENAEQATEPDAEFSSWSKAFNLKSVSENQAGMISELKQVESAGRQAVFFLGGNVKAWSARDLLFWGNLINHRKSDELHFSIVQIATNDEPLLWTKKEADQAATLYAVESDDHSPQEEQMTIGYGFENDWALKYLLRGQQLKEMLKDQSSIAAVFKKLDQIVSRIIFLSLWLDSPTIPGQLHEIKEQVHLGELDQAIYNLQVVV